MDNMLKIFLGIFLITSLTYAKKTVSVGGSVSEAVVALGHEKDLVAVDISSIYPKTLGELPNVGYWLQLSKEGILSVNPELIIASENSGPKDVIDTLKKFKIELHLIDDKPTLESALLKIKQVGKALGKEQKANEIIKRLQTNVESMKKEIDSKEKTPKVLYMFSRGEGMSMAAGVKTKAGAMINMAGGKNVISLNSFSQISTESILEMNPDVILTSSHRGPMKFDMSVLKNVNAIKNNQVYDMDMLLVSGFSVRLDEALKQMSCNIHQQTLSYCKK